MIFIFFVIANGDSAEVVMDTVGIDSAEAVMDTMGMDSAEVVMDTMGIDSAKVYEVPVIVDFHTQTELEKNFFITQEIIPELYDLYLVDVFFQTPFLLNKNNSSISISQRSSGPKHTSLFLNYHPIIEPLFGYFDLARLPIQFFENVIVDREYPNNLDIINLTSKINCYDKPFSSLKFTTMGPNTIYNIDFTRSLTSNLGFYLSGLYSNSWVKQDSLYSKINSFYTNFYYNRLMPMRLDIVYTHNYYGPYENGNFIDASLVLGSPRHKMAVYHELITTTNLRTSTINKIKNYGIRTESYYHPKNFEIFYGFTGSLSNLETESFGDHSLSFFGLWFKLNKVYKSLVFSMGNELELTDAKDFYAAPQFTLGLGIFNATYLHFSLAGNFRRPTISEMYAPPDTSKPNYWTRGNPNLNLEYYWTQEIGIKRKNLFLNLYKTDFKNLIVFAETSGYYIPKNIAACNLVGIENYLEVPLGLGIGIGFSSNYLVKGETQSNVPKANANLLVLLKEKYGQAFFKLMLKGQYAGRRNNISGQKLAPFTVFSIMGEIKFITLSCALRIDNILDEDIGDYPIAGRNFNLSVKWEFWD